MSNEKCKDQVSCWHDPICKPTEDSESTLTDLLCDADKIKKSLSILNTIKTEIPITIGEPNLQLIYDDICEAVEILESA